MRTLLRENVGLPCAPCVYWRFLVCRAVCRASSTPPHICAASGQGAGAVPKERGAGFSFQNQLVFGEGALDFQHIYSEIQARHKKKGDGMHVTLLVATLMFTHDGFTTVYLCFICNYSKVISIVLSSLAICIAAILMRRISSSLKLQALPSLERTRIRLSIQLFLTFSTFS